MFTGNRLGGLDLDDYKQVLGGFPCGSAFEESACNAGNLGSILGFHPWRKTWQPTPVFWPGKFHGLYSPWGRKESDMAEQISHKRVFLPTYLPGHIWNMAGQKTRAAPH